MKAYKQSKEVYCEAWRQYLDGRDYKRRIGLFETVRENERFYRGDQWKGVDSGGLPTPVFNVIGRIVGYLVNSVVSYQINVSYSDASLPYLPVSADSKKVQSYLSSLNRYLVSRWDKYKMPSLIRDAVLDAAISGDGVLYTYWDDSAGTGQLYSGDFRTITVDNSNVFVSDMNVADIQSQDYIILSGRTEVDKLRREAREHGVPEDEIRRIRADSDTHEQQGDMSDFENSDLSAQKTTYIIRFHRNKDGFVVWEKCTETVVIRSEVTTMTLYPVCYFNWSKTKNSFHGTSPITPIIGNQKYINKAYAMAMKHMTDTAFSKVIYDKKLIPEWTNEVGQAIGVVSGGDIENVAKILDTGKMEEEYLSVIDRVVQYTKDMSGATEVALGEADPTNTSAIIALREAAEMPLDAIRRNLYRCIEDLAMIWFEMMCEYYTDGRLVDYVDSYGDEDDIGKVTAGNGKHKVRTASIDFQRLKQDLICAQVESGTSKRYSEVTLLNILDTLLKSGNITFVQYLERLPEGIITDRAGLIGEAKKNMTASITDTVIAKEGANG